MRLKSEQKITIKFVLKKDAPVRSMRFVALGAQLQMRRVGARVDASSVSVIPLQNTPPPPPTRVIRFSKVSSYNFPPQVCLFVSLWPMGERKVLEIEKKSGRKRGQIKFYVVKMITVPNFFF